MSNDDHLAKAINWAKEKSISNLKSKAEGYEDPGTFINQSTEEKIQPDLSFNMAGGAKHYTVIATKKDDIQKLVTKWKLLSLRASIKKENSIYWLQKGIRCSPKTW